MCAVGVFRVGGFPESSTAGGSERIEKFTPADEELASIHGRANQLGD
jgi:hypothetical protein